MSRQELDKRRLTDPTCRRCRSTVNKRGLDGGEVDVSSNGNNWVYQTKESLHILQQITKKSFFESLFHLFVYYVYTGMLSLSFNILN